jgi:hypothetical protein
MTVLVKRPRGTTNALVEADPAEGLLAAFLSGRSECTRRAYSQDLDDLRRFVGAGNVSEAARSPIMRTRATQSGRTRRSGCRLPMIPKLTLSGHGVHGRRCALEYLSALNEGPRWRHRRPQPAWKVWPIL